MAEVIFKLLRCDAEASHLLGWAKKQVKRLVEHAKPSAFQRTWNFGDTSVRASYSDGIARLWLEAAGTERMAVWATLPNPYPYRAAQVIERFPDSVPAPSMSATYYESTTTGVIGVDWTTTTLSRVTWTTWDGAQSVYEGRAVVRSKVNTAPSGNNSLYEAVYSDFSAHYFVDQYDQPQVVHTPDYTLLSGSVTRYGSDVNATYNISVSASLPPRSATKTRPNGALIVTSDGEVLASENIVNEVDRVVYSSAISQNAVPWAWYRFVVLGGIGIGNPAIYSHTMSPSQIPDDVIYPSPAQSVLPITTAPPDIENGYTTVSASAWLTTINNVYQEAINRRKKFGVDTFARAVESMRAGSFVTPPEWDYVFKRKAPKSDHTYRSRPISVSYYDVDIDSAVTERRVNASYVHEDADGTQRLLETSIVGTRTRQHTYHTAPGVPNMYGDTYGVSTRYQYTQWYVPPGLEALDPEIQELEEGPEISGLLFHSRLADGAEYGPGLFWSGVVQSSFNSVYHADSKFANIIGASGGPGYWSGMPGGATAAEMTPPVPAYENTLRGTTHDFFLQYYKNVKLEYDKNHVQTSEELKWLSSSLLPGMSCSVVFVSPVRGGDALGGFAAAEDIENITEVEINGVATFVYEGASSEVKFSNWRPLPSGANTIRIPIPAGYELTNNAIIIYNGIKWDDVKEKAKAQRKALADPNDPAHDPLMKAVLDALTPQE